MRQTTMLLLGLLMTAAGCQTPDLLVIQTQADPAFDFESTVGARLLLAAMPSDPEAAASADPQSSGQLTLDQRVLLHDVGLACLRSGFTLARDAEEADFVVFCGEAVDRREYRDYERVPISETTFGTYYRDGKARHFDAHTHTSVVVPVTRVQTTGVISLAAAPADDVRDEASAQRTPAQLAVWSGTISADFGRLSSDRIVAVQALLMHWGYSERVVIEFPTE